MHPAIRILLPPPLGETLKSPSPSFFRRQTAMPEPSSAPSTRKVALYANVGADLTHYDVDVGGAELIKRATVSLPASVQYAWPHASRRYLYVATSSSATGYGT